MIENIVINMLKADPQLAELVQGRIYPDVAQVTALPCVIMSSDSPVPQGQRWFFTQNLTFEIYAKTEKEAQAVRNRFYELLNKYDEINLAAMSEGIIIKEAHAVYASVSNHFPLENEQAREKIVSFDFQYTKCAKRSAIKEQ